MEVEYSDIDNRNEDPALNKTQTDPQMTVNDGDDAQTRMKEVTGDTTSQKRSRVWIHFNVIQGGDPENPRAKCIHCGLDYACHPVKNGTRSMLTHIDKCKKNPDNKVKAQRKLFEGLKKDGGGFNLVPTFSLEECRKALAHMVIVDELPFRFVEGQGFRHFIRVVQPKFTTIPSRITISRDCAKNFIEEKKKLKTFMKGQRICITTDTWTSVQNLNYMCVTAHFIDNEWKLHKKIIGFSVIPNHKGETIAKVLEMCLHDWGIDKILTITVDNASSNNVALQVLQNKTKKWKGTILDHEFLHIRCCAHILNLIVREGLNEMHESVQRIRSVVKFIRSSPARLQTFKKAVDIEFLQGHKSLLCLDVETRWNSTYMMLDAALKYQKAFDRLDDLDATFTHCLGEFDCDNANGKKGKLELPTDDDWNNARVFVKFLKLFYDATLRFSGTLHITSNHFFHEYFMIQNKLKELCESGDTLLKSMAQNMKLKHDKYWGSIDKMNMLLFIPIVLDPRYKLSYVKYCIDIVHGSEVADDFEEKIRLTLKRLYEWYFNNEVQMEVKVVGESKDMNLDCEEDELTALKSKYKKHMKEVGGIGNKTEVDRFLVEECEDEEDDSFSVLSWWKDNSTRFRVLSRIARDVLAIPVSTVASESVFSTSGRILDPFRSSLSPSMVEALVCCQNWLRNPTQIDLRAAMDEIEEYDKVDEDVFVGQKNVNSSHN